MKTPAELRQELFEKLSEHKKIEAFFKDSLVERMEIDNGWIENQLVQCLLECSLVESDPLYAWVSCINDDDSNLQILKNKLRPRDQYDEKMRDVLAELHGYYNLRKFGFVRVEALQEDGRRKKPDFSAEKDGQPYLFEVKNMRAPFDIENILRDKCAARRLIQPEVYSKLDIYFVASPHWRNIRLVGKETEHILKDLKNWLRKTFEAIESPTNPLSNPLRPFKPDYKGRRMNIECHPKKSELPNISFAFNDRDLEISNPLTKYSFLFGFANKVMRIVETGAEQLLEFDEDSSHRGFILIHWESTGEFIDWYLNECLAIVTSIDNLAKNISADLFVRLLDHDPLP